MIAMPEMPWTEDKRINDLLRSFIEGAISDKLAEIILDYEKGEASLIELLFPSNFPENNEEYMIYIMKGLYSLIISDKQWIPSLIMEYVMAQLIIKETDAFYDVISLDFEDDIEKYKEYILSDEEDRKLQNKVFDIPFTDEFKEKYIKSHMELWKQLEGITDDALTNGDIEDINFARECAEEDIENCWHFSKKWLEWLFWDADYTMLDLMTVGTLKNSWINDATGMINNDKDEGEFILPEDWLYSKDFKYVNKEPRTM